MRARFKQSGSGRSRKKSPTTKTRAAPASDAQERLLPFLLNPNSYPHRPRRVRLVQTHSSFVFLAPPFVFKVKKPVDFGFLNFSTLEKRRHFCEREVQLNRRLSPRFIWASCRSRSGTVASRWVARARRSNTPSRCGSFPNGPFSTA
jgi:hypothetical protein